MIPRPLAASIASRISQSVFHPFDTKKTVNQLEVLQPGRARARQSTRKYAAFRGAITFKVFGNKVQCVKKGISGIPLQEWKYLPKNDDDFTYEQKKFRKLNKLLRCSLVTFLQNVTKLNLFINHQDVVRTVQVA